MHTNGATNEEMAYLAGFFDGEGCVYRKPSGKAPVIVCRG